MRLKALVLAVALAATSAAAQKSSLPCEEGSTRFGVIGDSGTGGREQYEIARMLEAARQRCAFDFVIMLGDNLYGRERAKDYEQKFERPYKALLDAGVMFYASLGNHDDPTQVNYKLFNMDGRRYYTFTKGPIQFFVLDSTYMDPAQLDWLAAELQESTARWKISYFHHPLYSSGRRHGSELDLRQLVEPLFIQHGVDVVFAGHEHVYERIHPQNGIYHFTSGAAAKLRKGNLKRNSPLTAAGFDQDRSFMVVEVTDDELHFQAISRKGEIVDSGVIPRPGDTAPAATTR
ncbi:MAG TPA: metallophosphoesterase [Vicinamibacterales bacterium]|nr:metallophosphoesterase [Vicinamibacterales bacterium]